MSQATFTLHGLDEDNSFVRADVFAQKLYAFLDGLRAADKLANGRLSHRFMIAGLETGSAIVRVREKSATHRFPSHSGIASYERAVSAIYNGDRYAATLPRDLVASVFKMARGVSKRFDHAEVIFDRMNVIRIDDYLLRQTEKVSALANAPQETAASKFYQGRAIGSFDGVLRMMDSRGEALRAKLITTAGGIEIDCVINKSRVPEVREFLEVRVRVEGMAHYDGGSGLPTRVDVNTIQPLKKNADLSRWRGALRSGVVSAEDW